MSSPDSFRCFLVSKDAAGKTSSQITSQPLASLPQGEVLIRVAYSSLNYKDALSATGNPGVTRNYPHIPGIDAAGAVAESSSPDWKVGDEVIVTSYELGSGRWGGYAEYVRVPADWVVRLPKGLSLRDSMALGTAGFTAAQSVHALVHHGVKPEAGEIVVTGATGGVGSIAVALLGKLGYNVTAVSGKESAKEMLTKLGAKQIIGRADVDDRSGKPLLGTRWAGAVDTVGGNTLGTILRSTKLRGCVTACGLVGGTDLPVTVFPFILRGVTLAGIDSAWCPRAERQAIWNLLANDWKLTDLESITREIGWAKLDGAIKEILAGQVAGRVVVRADASN